MRPLAGRRMEREDQRRPRLPGEVEVAHEVTEDGLALADVGPRVGPAVGLRVEALTAEEIVLDELEVGVEAERLVVDVAAAGVGADHEGRNAQAVALAVD